MRRNCSFRLTTTQPSPFYFEEAKAAELKKIYDEGTAGDKTFEGFLYDYTKAVIGSLASELVEEFLFGKKN